MNIIDSRATTVIKLPGRLWGYYLKDVYITVLSDARYAQYQSFKSSAMSSSKFIAENRRNMDHFYAKQKNVLV